MYRSVRCFVHVLVLCGTFLTVAGCDYSSPSAPESSTPGPVGATITISAAGLDPAGASIATGQSVTFVNTDSVAHEVVSAPVPTYDECPAINRVGRLEPGQSMQTAALTEARSCGFVDLSRLGDPRWEGAINVQ